MHYLISECGVANIPLIFERRLLVREVLIITQGPDSHQMLRFAHTSCFEENVYRFAIGKSFPYGDKKGSRKHRNLLPVISESPTE